MKEYCFHFHDFQYDPDTDIVDCRFCGKKWHPAPEPIPSSQQKTKPSYYWKCRKCGLEIKSRSPERSFKLIANHSCPTLHPQPVPLKELG